MIDYPGKEAIFINKQLIYHGPYRINLNNNKFGRDFTLKLYNETYQGKQGIYLLDGLEDNTLTDYNKAVQADEMTREIGRDIFGIGDTEYEDPRNPALTMTPPHYPIQGTYTRESDDAKDKLEQFLSTKF